MQLKTRHKIATVIFRPIMRAYCRLAFNLKLPAASELRQISTPCFVVANHNSDLDPVFVSLCIPAPVFYVASDHIFRLGVISTILRYLFSPIPKLKSTSDIRTIRDVLSALRSGASAGVFPEGNRSWDGQTEDFSPAIGKLLRHAAVPIVVFRIHGAYMAFPRWGDTMRRGRVECRLVRVLTPDAVKQMSTKELTELIKNDLWVDAKEDQQQEPVRFKSKNLAQSIETVLYACPSCGAFSSIQSKGNSAYCGCGLRFEYDELGTLHGAPYNNIADWNRWQTQHLEQHLQNVVQTQDDAPIFSDDGQTLHSFERAQRNSFLDTGRFSIYRDRFAFEGEKKHFEFPLHNLLRVEIWGRLTLQFSTSDGRHYEIKSKKVRSAYKYHQACKILGQIRVDGVQAPKICNKEE